MSGARTTGTSVVLTGNMCTQVEAQRSYVRMVREFQDACDLNEQLTERLSQLQAA